MLMKCSAPVVDCTQPDIFGRSLIISMSRSAGCFKGYGEVSGEAQHVFMVLAQPVQRPPVFG